jgi:hypothetical protein
MSVASIGAGAPRDNELPAGAERVRSPRNWHIGAIVFVAALALYLPSVRYEFVWDDTYFVLRNLAIRTWSTWADDFRSAGAYAASVTDPRFFRPLRNLSYRIDWSIAGPRPAWWHAHNVLLHAVNAVLVWMFLRRVLPWIARLHHTRSAAVPATMAAFLGALAWAVHPVHTEAVAWVKSRDELLFTFWAMTSLLIIIAGARRVLNQRAAFAAAMAACAFALLSKEMAVSLPLLVAAIAWAVRTDRPAMRYLGAAAITMGALTGAYVVYRGHVLGGTAMCGYLAGSFIYEMLTMVRAAARYVMVTVWPAQLVADYSHFDATRSLLEPRWWGALAIVLATLVAALAARRRMPLVTLGIAWFWLALVPVSNVVPTMQFLAERFLYFPLVGGAVVVYALACEYATQPRHEVRRKHRRALRRIPFVAERSRNFILLSALALTLLTGRTTLRLGVWHDEAVLYAATLRDVPRNGRAMLNVVLTLANADRGDLAARWLNYFLASRDPVLRSVNPLWLLRTQAAVATRLQQWPEAAALWRRVVQEAPTDIDALSSLAVCEGMQGHHDLALAFFVQAARLDPMQNRLRDNVVTALENLGRHAEAEALLNGRLAMSDIQTTAPR